jgi:hypothetical protein
MMQAKYAVRRLKGIYPVFADERWEDEVRLIKDVLGRLSIRPAGPSSGVSMVFDTFSSPSEIVLRRAYGEGAVVGTIQVSELEAIVRERL